MTPLVSIILPTHNRCAFLPGAIASVQAQRYTDWELIIVDDGSQDDSAGVVQPFQQDPRVRYTYQPQQGRSAARNHGIELAQGEWVAFLDSDDRYLPNGLADHLSAAGIASQPAMTLGGYEYIDDQDHPLGARRPWEESDLSLPAWLFNCLGMPGSVMVARRWLQDLGGFDPECEIAEDWDLFLRLAQAGAGMAWTKSLVCQYRQHAGQSVLSLAQHQQGTQRTLEKFFRQPSLAPELAALAGPATAWGHVLFARRAFQTGQLDMAGGLLAQALTQDPQLFNTRKEKLLEFLLTPLPGEAEPPPSAAADLARLFTNGAAVTAGDIRRAQARVAVAAVWRWSGRVSQPEAWPAVRRAYWQGVSHDPRWLGNRGLWSILLRAWAAHRSDRRVTA